MDCFEIEWKGAYHCDHPENLPVLNRPVIYAFYKIIPDWFFDETKELLYIGQSQNSIERLWTEIQGLSRGMSDEELEERVVFIGVISSFDDPTLPITPKQLDDIESFFIRKCSPPRNKQGVASKPKHIPLLIVNTGKELFDPVLSHNTRLLELLKKSFE